MTISSIPTRSNGDTILASWFNDLKNEIINSYGDGALITKTADYTAVGTDSVIEIDATSNTVTITIPEAITANKGKTYTVLTKDITYSAIIIPTAGLINGLGSFSFVSIRHAIILKSNGVEWVIVANTNPPQLTNCLLTSAEVTDWLYFGDSATDGSRRIGLVGTDLITQERISTVWTTVKTEGSLV